MDSNNPAEELRLTFVKWSTGKGTAESRNFKDRKALLQAHEQTMQELVSLRRIVTNLREDNRVLASFEKHIPAVVSAVLALQTGFNSNGADSQNVDTSMLLALEYASHEIERLKDEGERQRPVLNEAFAEIRELLVVDETAAPEMKAFIQALMTSIRHHLETSQLGLEFDLEQAMKQLWVALVAIQVSSSNPGRWSHFASKMKTVSSIVLGKAPQWMPLPGAIESTVRMINGTPGS